MPLRPLLVGFLAAVAVSTGVGSVSAQRLDEAAMRARLAEPSRLDASEIDQVLVAVRAVAGGKPFRFAAEQGGFAADILFERDGHVRFIRTQVNNTISFTAYTGRMARFCDGTIAAGELVLEYQQTDGGWVVSTRASSLADLLRPVFDMLVGLKPLVDEGIMSDGARVLSAGWNLPAPLVPRSPGGGGGAGESRFALADPTVSGTERLVIDPASLRPLRWEFAVSRSKVESSSGPLTRSYRFDYDTDLVIVPPATGTTVPDCVDSHAFSPAFPLR